MLKPTYSLKSVVEITPQMLKRLKISALILDVDNTLTTHNNPLPAKKIPEWICEMKEAGIKLIIVSNNSSQRVLPFAEKLGLEFISRGAKPLTKGYKAAIKKLRVRKQNVCAVGDQIFTDIAGANLAGIRSIFVYPIEFESGIFFKIKRFAEKPFLPSEYVIKK